MKNIKVAVFITAAVLVCLFVFAHVMSTSKPADPELAKQDSIRWAQIDSTSQELLTLEKNDLIVLVDGVMVVKEVFKEYKTMRCYDLYSGSGKCHTFTLVLMADNTIEIVRYKDDPVRYAEVLYKHL